LNANAYATIRQKKLSDYIFGLAARASALAAGSISRLDLPNTLSRVEASRGGHAVIQINDAVA